MCAPTSVYVSASVFVCVSVVGGGLYMFVSVLSVSMSVFSSVYLRMSCVC